MYLHFREVGTYLVRGGNEILVDAANPVDPRLLQLCTLALPFGVLLRQRGLAVLHGSAISVNGSAVAFLAGRRMGKSTLASAMCRRGYGLVTDDILAIDLTVSDRPVALPSIPWIKLSRQVVSSLGDDPDALEVLYPGSQERWWAVAYRFQDTALPVSLLYVLGEGPTTHTEALSRRDATMELMRHSYALDRRDPSAVAAFFRQCVGLTRVVPLRRLIRPLDLAGLPAMVAHIESDMRGI